MSERGSKEKKRRAWNSTLPAPTKPLRRSSAPPRKKGPAKVNRKRLKLRREETYGASGMKAAWIRTWPCIVPSRLVGVRLIGDPDPVECTMVGEFQFNEAAAAGCTHVIQAMHTKSRGAGGKAEHMVPACSAHHAESHNIGIKTFAKKYDLDLDGIASRYEHLWKLSPHNPENQQ